MKIVKLLINYLGLILKLSYRYVDDTYPDWKYIYFFFYQRILLFNCHIPWPCHPTSYITGYKNIKFGSKTSPGSGPNQYIQGKNGIVMGNNVQIGPGVNIISANHNFSDFDSHIPSKPIIIGDNVWIGSNSVILPEIIIGSNVIIGAGSVVTKNIKSNSIAVGNPCKIIKSKDKYSGV